VLRSLAFHSSGSCEKNPCRTDSEVIEVQRDRSSWRTCESRHTHIVWPSQHSDSCHLRPDTSRSVLSLTTLLVARGHGGHMTIQRQRPGHHSRIGQYSCRSYDTHRSPKLRAHYGQATDSIARYWDCHFSLLPDIPAGSASCRSAHEPRWQRWRPQRPSYWHRKLTESLSVFHVQD
jgi:hypothetical protein